MILLPIALTAAAAAAILNIWLSMRIGSLRRQHKVSVGDGGLEPLARRMRAQLNFAENTPIVLVLVAVIELARPASMVLLAVTAAYLIGRIAHAAGMDGGALQWGRMVGTLTTMLVQVGLAGWAVWIVAGA